MKTFALLSLVAVSVSAPKQDSGSSSSSAPVAAITAPVIPTSVSQGCGNFLNTLDADSGLQSCLAAINSATNNITPKSSSSDITGALGNLCGTSTTSACTDQLVRQKLTDFSTNCQGELAGANPNSDVQTIYSNLFLLEPLQKSLCSDDGAGNFCVSTLAQQAASANPSSLSLAQNFLSYLVQQPLSKRDSPFSASGQYNKANATTFTAAGVPFFFLNPSTPQSTLCSKCAQKVAQSYINFETSLASAVGLPQDSFLSGQKALWTAFQNQCGAAFASGVVANAGASPTSTGNVTLGGALGAATTVKVSAGGLIAALVGALFAL